VVLANVIAAGNCTNCDIAWDSKGRVISASNGTGGGGAILTGSKIFDLPSLLNGEIVTTTVTLTGADPGDIVQASFSTVMPEGVFISHAQVTGEDEVTVTIVNESGDAQDVGSGTLKVSTLTPAVFLSVLTAYDPPSLDNGETVSIDITVTGAQIGDVCAGGIDIELPAGVYLGTPQVIASNIVRHTIVNASGETVNISPASLRTSIWR
jgi:hypothetical protein